MIAMAQTRRPARQEGPAVRHNMPNGAGGGHAPLLTRRGLVAWLRVSERHSYELERAGLPRIELGGCVRFDVEDVVRFLDAHRRRSTASAPMHLDAKRLSELTGLRLPSCPTHGSGPVSPPEATEKRTIRGSGRAVLAGALPDSSVGALARRLAAQAAAKFRRKGGRA